MGSEIMNNDKLDTSILASDYAKRHNTTTDVIITLIKNKQIHAIKGNDKKWYIPHEEPLNVSDNYCRLIHITNQLQKIFDANHIKTRPVRIRRFATIYSEYARDSSSTNICFNLQNREVYTAKYPKIGDINITEMMLQEGLPITNQSTYERIVHLLNQKTYNSYTIVAPYDEKYATAINFNNALITAEKLLNNNNHKKVKIYYRGKKVQTLTSDDIKHDSERQL